jgi:FkbM family methyltransferase
VSRALRSGRHELRRRRRRRAEARGDERWSRPALYGLDRKLEAHLPAHGFFIEAGAHDGYTQSNTYHLERFGGWTGLLVEAVPELWRAACRERPGSRVVNCALVEPERSGEPVTVRFAGLTSLVAGARGDHHADEDYLDRTTDLPFMPPRYDVEVPGRTLSELLDEMGSPEVDFASLDLEGYEPEALAGLDLDRHAPRFILVEVQDDVGLARVEGRLAGRYRQVERLTPMDVLFARIG